MFHPGFRGAGAISSIAFFNSATSTGVTLTAPASIQAGDILVFFDRAVAGSVPSAVTPTGFTQVANNGDGSVSRIITSYKLADGSEAGATITGMTGSVMRKIMAVWRPDVPANVLTLLSVHSQLSAVGAPSSQTCTAATGPAPLLVVGTFSSGSGTIAAAFSPTQDATLTNTTVCSLAYLVQNGSPADVAVSMNNAGVPNCLHSFYLVPSL